MEAIDAHMVRNLLEKVVAAPERLFTYRSVSDPDMLMKKLSAEFGQASVSSSHLLMLIQQSEGLVIEPKLPALLSFWRPAAYSIQQSEVQWRLIGETLPFAPFYDDQIAQIARRSILSMLLTPRTRLDYLLKQAGSVEMLSPKGFIYHLSRCGSTLVANAMAASGCFTVLSEASYLRDLLLDPQLSEEDKVRGLKVLLSCHGPDTLVKLNAWDIQFFPLIQKAFPTAPSLFLVRNPEAILASHRRLAGIHMVPGNRVADQIGVEVQGSLEDYQAEVLASLMEVMLIHGSRGMSDNRRMLDYRQVSLELIVEIAAFFGCRLSEHQKTSVAAMMKLDAKDISKRYASVETGCPIEAGTNDSGFVNTGNVNTGNVKKSTREWLSTLYSRCLSNVLEVSETTSY